MSLSFTLFQVSSLHNQDLGLAPTKKRAWTPSANFFGTWTFPTSDIFASDQTPGQHNCAHQLCLDVHHDFMCWTHVLNAGTLQLMCATHIHTENTHTHKHTYMHAFTISTKSTSLFSSHHRPTWQLRLHLLYFKQGNAITGSSRGGSEWLASSNKNQRPTCLPTTARMVTRSRSAIYMPPTLHKAK